MGFREAPRPIEMCIVDDERIVCERLQPVFEKNGFLVESFTDSRAARERLAQKRFDILITDLKMAHPDGIELLHFARQQFAGIRVVIITGFATAETARRAMKGGAVDFIVKPFRLSHLRDLVQRIAQEIREDSSIAPG
jgi:DNA-binding NtrC family response regulator